MALFGEILEPSSRALWDNAESDEEDNVPLLCWTIGSKPPDDLDLLLVFEGTAAVEFAERCFVCKSPIDETSDKKVKMHWIEESNMCVCTIEGRDTVVGDLLVEWTKAAKRVVAVQSGYGELLGGTNGETRALRTSQAPPPVRPLLHQPNILNGVSAGIISLREHLNQAATVYGVFAETSLYGLDTVTSEPYKKLLNDLNIDIPKPFMPKCKVLSNLYM